MAAMPKKVMNIARQSAIHRMPLSQRRGDGGNQYEHRHRKGHDARHAPAFVLIANERHGDDAGRRYPDALEHASGEHRLEGGSEDGHDAAGHDIARPAQMAGFRPMQSESGP